MTICTINGVSRKIIFSGQIGKDVVSTACIVAAPGSEEASVQWVNQDDDSLVCNESAIFHPSKEVFIELWGRLHE